MSEPLVHEHFLLRAEVENPSTNRRQVTKFLNKLIKKIKMNTLYGPVTSKCKQEGNRGITAFAIIETSHISMHIWDECQPGNVHFDVYSCAPFKPDEVVEHFKSFFKVIKMDYKFVDRENRFIDVKV